MDQSPDCQIEQREDSVVIHLRGDVREEGLARLEEIIQQTAGSARAQRIELNLRELDRLSEPLLHSLEKISLSLAALNRNLSISGTRPEAAQAITKAGLGALLTAPIAVENKGPLVLVIDDERLVLNVVRDFLKHAGYTVITAGDAREALALFDTHQGQIQLFLIDLTLPDMTGMELLETLVKKDPAVKAVLASGWGDEAMRAMSTHPNVRAILQKPFTGRQLVQTVQEAMQAR